MNPSFKLRLPSKKDWAWVLALMLLGGAFGFGMNAIADPGVGINLKIALSPDEAPPADAPDAPDSPDASTTTATVAQP